MARFRKGDEVQLTGIVAIDYDYGTRDESGVHIDIVGGWRHQVDRRHVKLTRPVFAVGDQVSWPNGNAGTLSGEVVAIAGTGLDALLWVRLYMSKRMDTLDAIICKRIDTPPPPADMAAIARDLAGGE